jgi:hypothetical protein
MITISTRIPEGMDKQLSALAAATDRKKGYLVRRALEHYLSEQKKALATKTEKKKKKLLPADPWHAASYEALARVWDNDDDAVYDRL